MYSYCREPNVCESNDTAGMCSVLSSYCKGQCLHHELTHEHLRVFSD